MDVNEFNEAGWAYVAGLFDGEGYIRCSFKKHHKGRKRGMEFGITVTNTYRPILEYLRMSFGGSIYESPSKSSKHKMSCFWKLTSRNAFVVLSQIAPYLKIKREPANHVLRNKALMTKKGPRSESERKALTDLTNKMSAFTRRGVSNSIAELNSVS
jgi:hypothetical protein